MVIRHLEQADIQSFIAIRREALELEPLAFVASPSSDVGLDEDFLRRAIDRTSSQAVFGIWSDELVGFVGAYRYPKEKEAHKAGIWGMYVSPPCRGRGLGAALLGGAVDFVRSLPGVTRIVLSVSETSEAALRLYLRAGFEIWGTERDAIRVGERRVAVHYMVLEVAALGD